MTSNAPTFDSVVPLFYVGDVGRPRNRAPESGGRGSNTSSLPPFPWWGTVLFLAIGFIFATGTVEFFRIEIKLSSLDTKINDVDQNLRDLTTRVDNLPQQISKAFLSKARAAVTGKNLVAAARALDGSTVTIGAAAEEQLKAPPEFFAQAIEQLDTIQRASDYAPELALPLHQVRLALAHYRSTLQPLPRPIPPTRGRGIVVTPPPPPKLFALSIEGGGVAGVTQKLDYIRWKDYIFVNCVIEYDGGAVKLDHVLFVNCTFRVKLTAQAAKFIDYAALALPSISIG
jgi:hypothetical protein